jgi:hypothetical protein
VVAAAAAAFGSQILHLRRQRHEMDSLRRPFKTDHKNSLTVILSLSFSHPPPPLSVSLVSFQASKSGLSTVTKNSFSCSFGLAFSNPSADDDGACLVNDLCRERRLLLLGGSSPKSFEGVGGEGRQCLTYDHPK